MNKKLKRFLELSLEFTINDSDIYGTINSESNYITYSGSMYVENLFRDPIPESTKLEKLQIICQEKIDKAGRWEEYKILREDLNNYYKAEDKIFNK